MQTDSSNIWTRVTLSISYDSNQHPTGASIEYIHVGASIFVYVHEITEQWEIESKVVSKVGRQEW